MKKIIFSFAIATCLNLGPAANIILAKNYPSETSYKGDDKKKKKKSCDAASKEKCSKEKKSCCAQKSSGTVQ